MEVEDLFCLCHVSAKMVQETSPASLSASRNRMDHVYLEKKPRLPPGSEMRSGAGCFLLSLCERKLICFFDSQLSLHDIILTN